MARSPFPEDEYGRLKRFEFVCEAVSAHRPRTVLDVGCGTGELLTNPVAERHPTIEFTGVDEDERTIEHARTQAPANVRYAVPGGLDNGATFDMVWASEVLEHVDEPEEFLLFLRRHLSPSGRLIVTVPNGYGPFEVGAAIETLLILSGAMRLLRRLRPANRGGRARTDRPATLAVSPHVNFFSHRRLVRLLEECGLKVAAYAPRTFLCGFVFGRLGKRRVAWNAAIVDRLPPQLASDWMFVLEPAPGSPHPGRTQRGRYERIRRDLNLRRWANPVPRHEAVSADPKDP